MTGRIKFPRVEVIPFTETDNVTWEDGKPRCTRHRGVCLVKATAVGLSGPGHVCHQCMREHVDTLRGAS